MKYPRQNSMEQNSMERSIWIGLVATALIGAFVPAVLSADDAIQFLGVAELPGTALDRSGLENALEDGSPHNRVGGLSAIEYSGVAAGGAAAPTAAAMPTSTDCCSRWLTIAKPARSSP